MTPLRVDPHEIAMAEREQIGQERIPRLLRQMQKDRTLLRMRLLGTNYERLTIITGVKASGPRPCFFLDYPEGFREAVEGSGSWRLFFEFTGKDNVFHAFKTKDGGFSDKGQIRIDLPSFIERIQRRKDFRVPAFPGVTLTLGGKYGSRRVVAVNISAGGALFSFEGKEERDAPFRPGQVLKDLWVEYRVDETWMRAQVREAVVKRSAQEIGTGMPHYAVQFTDMEKAERKSLMEIIYALQRDHLRKRRDGPQGR